MCLSKSSTIEAACGTFVCCGKRSLISVSNAFNLYSRNLNAFSTAFGGTNINAYRYVHIYIFTKQHKYIRFLGKCPVEKLSGIINGSVQLITGILIANKIIVVVVI